MRSALSALPGQLQTSAALDYETDNAYSVTVSVSDGNGRGHVIALPSLSVSRMPMMHLCSHDGDTSTTRAIAENTAANTNIGNCNSRKPMQDNGDTLTYTLGGNPDVDSFGIVSTTGQIPNKSSTRL